MAENETFDVTRIAHHLHVPGQVVRAAQWQIPTLVLIRKPRVAELSLVIRDPLSIDRALRHDLSFYETAGKYRDAYVLGLFDEVTADFGQVIRRINDKLGTTFAAANTSCEHRSEYSEGDTEILLVHRRFSLLPAVVQRFEEHTYGTTSSLAGYQ